MLPTRFRTFACSTLLFVVAGGVLAEPTLGQEPDSVVAIEPIMVRVLRSAIGTGTPYPVSVVTGSQLTRGTSSTFVEEALRAVPGVQIHNRYNLSQGERIIVRGSGSRAQFGVRGIRILVDGIPATLPDGQTTLDHLDLGGLGRVEVLRGPNATLYGNAAGGVIHFRTIDPATVPASAGIRWTSGSLGSTTGAAPGSTVSHDLWTMEGFASGTAGDVGYRADFTRTDFDGYRRNPIANDGSTFGAGTRSVFNGVFTLPLGQGTLRLVANGVDLNAENPGSLPVDSIDSDRDAWRGNIAQSTTKDAQQGQVGLAWEGLLGGTTSEFAAWGIRRELLNPIPNAIIDLSRNAGGARALVRGRRPAGDMSFSWSAGIEAEFQRDRRLNSENDAGAKGVLTLDQLEHVRSNGVFAQARLDAGSGFSVLAGARYDRIAFEVDDYFLANGDPDDSGSRTMDAFSPSVGVVFAPNPKVEVYGSLGRSFESPSTTELANRPSGAGGFNPDLDPQIGTTIEGGVRTTLAQSVRVEASLYRTDFDDQLVPFTVPMAGDRDFYRNAGTSRITGWEASVDWHALPWMSTRLSFTRLNARFVDFVTEGGDYSGNEIPGLAPHRFDGMVVLQRASGFMELRGLWQDELPANDANTAASPSYFLADAVVGTEGFAVGGLSWSPFLGIDNIFDERYNASIVPNAFGGRFFEPGPPRTFRIGMGVTWRG